MPLPDEDIENALKGLASSDCASKQASTADDHSGNVMAMSCFSPWCRLLGTLKSHPWGAAIVLGASLTCAKWVCVYFGVCLLAWAMVWGMTKKG